MNKGLEILQKYWNYDSFRPFQQEIVDAAIYGHDTLALLPTGGGKSICFQIPGMAREGVCLVISPLIALMEDQVMQLKKRGIQAEYIASGLSYRDVDYLLDKVRFGKVKFLYTSPERIQSELFLARFKQMNVGLIVVDEAHCISQWGFDFRPSFLKISSLRSWHPEVPIMALTATATKQTKEDIVEKLALKQYRFIEGNFLRSNLGYEIKKSANKDKDLLHYTLQNKGKSGIVYCQTRKSTKNVAKLLHAQGIRVSFYHGGLDREERSQRQSDWIRGKVDVMIATNAFGMGIDKPDVRFVLHYEFPDSLEAYFQEAGRAGRDGHSSKAVTFLEEDSLRQLRVTVEERFPELETVKSVYRALCNHLRIAYGSGKEETYPIDLALFADKYKFNLVEVFHCLKILELNGTLTFSENALLPTRLKVVVEHKTLYNFQVQNKNTDPLITLIIRSYTRVFDEFVEINEVNLCKRLSISMSTLQSQLEYLEKNGIIEITWRCNEPQITFSEERLPDNYFSINQAVLQRRKIVALEKLEAVEQFLTKPVCRSIQLLAYFGQQSSKCGVCDICQEETVTFSENETMLQKRVLIALKQEAMSFEQLQARFNDYAPQLVSSVLHRLIDDGVIHLKNNILTI